MHSLIEFTLAFCAILAFASFSGLVSERAGVVNIGIEGMMTIGALVTAIIGTVFNPSATDRSNGSQFIAVLVAGIVAAIFAMLHAFPSITLKSNQVISGTALNILALGIAAFISTGGFFGTSPTTLISFYVPINIGGIFPVWLLIAIVVGILIAVFFKFSKFGMRYTMVGENPNAVDSAGISVNKYRYIAVAFSGFLAGIAGGVFITTVVANGNFGGSVFGYGFLAMGIMIFGQWRIHYISLGVILFAILFALGSRLGVLSNNPAVTANAMVFKILPFALTLGVMVVFSKNSKAPAADGIPFDKSKR